MTALLAPIVLIAAFAAVALSLADSALRAASLFTPEDAPDA